ncbi:hypothetical protein EV127DRAFT_79010 [Xylaria flabelliformis]|nr:hypothetical protein EV127DRAFT_79010 [Xylaria flabelliformis]
MAEAFGVAASGIAVAQVAAQVGKSIIKLKRLWDDFKDVPSSIGDLLDQIDCLDPALWEAENTFTQASLPPMFWDSSLGSRSTVYCRKALISLTELIDELTLQLNQPGKLRRKVAIAKVVLKKEQLRSLERRLQNAITMLSLAQSSYLVALTRIQPDIVIQRITESKLPLLTQTFQDDFQEVQFDDISDAHKRKTLPQTIRLADNEQFEDRALPPRRYTKKRENSVYSIRCRLPTWICQATWELQTFRSYGNWQINIRYYRTQPLDNDVFIAAFWHTPKELQMLFASGRASPDDRDADFGHTLLHWAALGLNRPMVKYLLDIGLSPSEIDDYGEAPITKICDGFFNGDLVSFLAEWSFSDELDILSDAQDYLDSESTECNCRIGLLSKEFLKMFQHLECPHHESATLESRLRSLRRASGSAVHPEVIPDLLQGYWTQDLRALCIESLAIYPLTHIVADGLGRAGDNLVAEWASLAETVIRNTPDIYHVDEEQSTPLIVVIRSSSFSRRQSRYMSMRRLITCVNLWLSKVQSSGHDLEEYGRRENEMLMDKQLQLDNACEFAQYSFQRGRWRYFIGRIRGYQYGPQPKDWKILWSFPEKSYAADFWRLVEDGPQLVPGAWVEDSDDEVEESDDEVNGWL